MKKQRTIVLSLGGSLINTGVVNVAYLRKFRQIILKFIQKGNRVIIVCGGGQLCRSYNEAARKINRGVTDIELDWLGISTTKVNAELLRVVFGKKAYEQVLPDPRKAVATYKKILIGCGFVPGSSSDKDATLLAKTYSADTVINLTNVDYVYDKNPKQFKNAKPQKKLTWSQFLKIVGTTWSPGANAPFGVPAAKFSKKNKIKVIIVNGAKLANLKNVLSGKRFIGTEIKD